MLIATNSYCYLTVCTTVFLFYLLFYYFVFDAIIADELKVVINY